LELEFQVFNVIMEIPCGSSEEIDDCNDMIQPQLIALRAKGRGAENEMFCNCIPNAKRNVIYFPVSTKMFDSSLGRANYRS
jgi:hypothetical protein